MQVICNKAGSHDLCNGCGASVPHHNLCCEPCPVVPDAQCVEVELQHKKGKPIIFIVGASHLPPVSHLTDIVQHNSVFIAASVESEDERRKDIFNKYKNEFFLMYSLTTSKKNPLGSMTYDNFKLEYQLIKDKKSKLPSNFRKIIEDTWVQLFET